MAANEKKGRTMATDTEIQTAADEHYQSRFGEIERLLMLQLDCQQHNHWEWQDAISEQLQEMPLAVDLLNIDVRREELVWEILLGTGGPADRVRVVTDYSGEVEWATYEHQDWFTPWTEARGQNADIVLQFAQQFSYYVDLTELF